MTEEDMQMQRFLDFWERAADEPAGARKLRAGGEVVTIHPMADQSELLTNLEMRPSDCAAVDAYWAVGGDVVFLQLHTAASDSHRPPGLYARLATYPPMHVNWAVVVEDNVITSAVLERETARLNRFGWNRSLLGDALVPLPLSA